MVVPVWPCSRVPSTRPKPWSSLTGSTPRLMTLTSQGLIVAATTADAKTPQKWYDYFSGQDVMTEFTTANDNMGDFTYMPGFSAVGAAMKQTAAKATDGSAKVSDVFDAAQKTSVDTLKNYGLSVKRVTSLGLVTGPASIAGRPTRCGAVASPAQAGA